MRRASSARTCLGSRPQRSTIRLEGLLVKGVGVSSTRCRMESQGKQKRSWRRLTHRDGHRRRTWCGYRRGVPDGLGRLLSGGASGPSGCRRRLLDGRASGHGRRVPPFREGYRTRHLGGAGAGPGRVPRCRSPSCCSRGRWCSRVHRAGRSAPTFTTGGPGRPARTGAIPTGPAAALHGRERHPVTHVAYSDCGRVRDLGRQGPAHRGRMGVRRPRRPGGKVYCWGDEFAPGGG